MVHENVHKHPLIAHLMQSRHLTRRNKVFLCQMLHYRYTMPTSREGQQIETLFREGSSTSAQKAWHQGGVHK